MSQNIADMPGIEAAMERFNAMVPAAPATTETAGGSATGSGGTTGVQSTARRDPSRVSDSNKADAQPTANKEPLPHGRGSDDQAQNSVTSTNTDARAATDTKQTVTGAAGNGNQQRDDKGRFQAANEDGRSKIEDGKQTNKPLRTGRRWRLSVCLIQICGAELSIPSRICSDLR
ncbi:MAG TPA: hypothetical protein VNV43_15045 [Candidatus Acidoferrales bacterium]|jgi:hypothetical protein|nr:hypothetical protein [Candidatus Acidoferrales bacterium]